MAAGQPVAGQWERCSEWLQTNKPAPSPVALYGKNSMRPGMRSSWHGGMRSVAHTASQQNQRRIEPKMMCLLGDEHLRVGCHRLTYSVCVGSARVPRVLAITGVR